MDIGTGVAVTGVAIAISVAIIGVFGKGKSPHNICIEHSAVKQQMIDIVGWLKRIDEKLDTALDRRKNIKGENS